MRVLLLVALAIWPTNARVDRAESTLAGKPVTVKCYSTYDEWDARVRDAYSWTRAGYQVTAFTYPGDNTIEAGNLLCTTLMYALRVGPTKVTDHMRIGRVINVLAHEAQHAYGIVPEAEAEACGKRYYGRLVHDLFNIPYRTATMRRLITYAYAYSATLDTQYQGGTCPR